MADEAKDKKDTGAAAKETEQQRHARVGAEDRAKAAEAGVEFACVDPNAPSDMNMYAGTAIGREVGAMTQGTGTMHLNRKPNVYPTSVDEEQAARYAPAFRGKVVDPSEVSGDTVRMFLPIPVLLTVSHGQQVRFNAGEQDVPRDYSTHAYLLAHGARLVNKNEGEKVSAESEQQKAEDAAREAELAQDAEKEKGKAKPDAAAAKGKAAGK